MKKYILTVFAATLILTSCDIKFNDDNSEFINILYNVRGGYVSINETIIIGFNGFSEMRYLKYKLHFQLPDSVFENLNRKFEEADFFNLEAKYPLHGSGYDCLSFTIMYSTGYKSKSIKADWCGKIPDKLEELLITLYKTRHLIISNPDVITLHISWIYKIKEWPFSDILRLKIYHFDYVDLDTESRFNDIICYFDSLKYDNQNYLFLENDYLYQVSLVRDEEDSNQLYIIQFEYYTELPEIFGFRLNEFSRNSYAVSQNIKGIKKFLRDHYLCVFIEDNLTDGVRAGNIYFIPGK